MIADAVAPDLYVEYLAKIGSEETRDAFFYIVGRASCLTELRCYPKNHGVVPAFRFFAWSEDQPFAFIPNNNWLLFYFRAPAVRSKRYSLSELRSIFESTEENSSGEWTVKLRNIEDVRRLFHFLQLE